MTPEDTSAAAREIAPEVYCLGPKGRTQTDVYLLRSGSSWALIDAGWAKDGDRARAASSLGVRKCLLYALESSIHIGGRVVVVEGESRRIEAG